MKYLLALLLLSLPCVQAWPRAGGGGGGGCFPAGTQVATTAGDTPIEKLRAGDKVLSFSDGRLMQVPVEKVYAKRTRLLTVFTTKSRLVTTGEHPLLTRYGFTEAGKLKPGDELGMLLEGRLVWVKIKKLKYGGEADVYNLEVAPPHTFIAEGFVVHNKGGGGGGGYRSHSGRGGLADLIVPLIMVCFVLFAKAKESLFGVSTQQGRTVSREEAGPRGARTRAIMSALAESDPSVRPETLEEDVKRIFLDMQSAWQKRDYTPLLGRMSPELYSGHSAKVAAMRQRGEINRMEDVSVQDVEFVHIRYTPEKAERSFTVLISASARDYVTDESGSSLLSGSREMAAFQEFWTFRPLDGAWVPARIDQTTEDYILAAPNLPAEPGQVPVGPGGFAAAGLAVAAAAQAAYAPPAAPERPRAFDSSEDPWDRQKMEICATLAFQSVYEAWALGTAADLESDSILPETAARLKKIFLAAAADGLSLEFKDLYTRKAEIVLTTHARKTAGGLDEFTARINASAARTLKRSGKVLHQDAAPQPFTEYWVFARDGKAWKFSEILPRMKQEGGDACQADVAPTPAQLEWYWSA
jgi:predicted lipid-binding transport protein (Tim44 family)